MDDEYLIYALYWSIGLATGVAITILTKDVARLSVPDDEHDRPKTEEDN